MSTTAVVASSSSSSSSPGSTSRGSRTASTTTASSSMSSSQNDHSSSSRAGTPNIPSINRMTAIENGEHSDTNESLCTETLNIDTMGPLVTEATAAAAAAAAATAQAASSGEAAALGGDQQYHQQPAEEGQKPAAILKEEAGTGTTPAAVCQQQQQQQQDVPLPLDLRRILVEVAQTGISSSLSWNGTIRAAAAANNNNVTGGGTSGPAASPSSASYSGTKHARSSISGRPTQQHRPRPLYAAAAHPPSRKKHRNEHRNELRNGMHGVRQTKHSSTNKRSSHKRPLLSIRTNNNNDNNNNAAAAAAEGTTTDSITPGGDTSTTTTTTTTAGGINDNNSFSSLTISQRQQKQQQQQQHFSPASSGRTSGSEPEDTYSQYDSEGTTATTNSEISLEHSSRPGGGGGGDASSMRGGKVRGGGGVGGGADGSMGQQQEGASEESLLANDGADSRLGDNDDVDVDDDDAGCGGNQSSEEASVNRASRRSTPTYPSLKEAFRTALALVLDHWFRNRGGYKLSPAEIRRTAGVAVMHQPSQQSPSSSQPTIATAAEPSYQSNDGNAAVKQEYEGSNENENCSSAVNGTAPPKTASASPTANDQNERAEQASTIAEEMFRQRRNVLLNMLCKVNPPQPQAAQQQLQTMDEGVNLSEMQQQPQTEAQNDTDDDVGPPFTIQRIAEVLISPERYYTQTHKLCNCLEKLLLVKSPTTAYGGSRGGDTSQSRREERELAALADERSRLKYEYRHRRLKRRASSLSDGENLSESNSETTTNAGASSRHCHSAGREIKNKEPSMIKSDRTDEDVVMGDAGGENYMDQVMTDAVESLESTEGENPITASDEQKREMLEAAARASLRTKFDHVGIDVHSSLAVANRDIRSIIENRSMTNSPPPPSLSILAAGSLLRQHSPEQHPTSIVRPPSPILFNSGVGGDDHDVSSPNGSPPQHHHAVPNVHILQMHHVAAAAGVSPFDLMHLAGGGAGGVGSIINNNANHSVAAAYANGGVSGISGSAAAAIALASGLKESDLESRSSEGASSDGMDSESDDVSFDDSASDRSDGSDSGYNYEASSFSAAARAMAQSRLQQQQRLQQSRLLTSLGSSSHYHQHQQQQQPQSQPQQLQTSGSAAAAATATSTHTSSSEFQSGGDFLDSFRGAEDSGGSDSSSSDAAD